MRIDNIKFVRNSCVLICMFTVLFFCIIKQDYFCDETASYGLANSYYAPFLSGVLNDNLTDRIITSDELMNFLTVSENERFSYDSVIYNQREDVHPPLFYIVLHTVCSFFPGKFSKWFGLIPSMLYYFFSLILLYKIAEKLFSEKIAIYTMILYGLSNTALSVATIIRMYMPLTMLSLLLTWIFLNLREKQNFKYYLLLFLTIFCGMLTHFFFVFYAFFGCAEMCLFYLRRKKYKTLITFSLYSILGVLMMVLVFPPQVNTVLNSHTPEMYLQMKDWFAFLYTMCKYMAHGVFWAGVVGGVALIALIFLKKYHRDSRVENNMRNLQFGWMFIPVAISFCIVLCVGQTFRYVYHLVVYLVLFVGFLLWRLELYIDIKYKTCIAVYGLVVLQLFSALFIFPPDYLYYSHKEGNRIVKEYYNSPCICLYGKNDHWGLYCAIAQLINFKEILLQEDAQDSKIADYINYYGANDAIIVYIFYYPEEKDEELLKQMLINMDGEYKRSLVQEAESSRMYLLQKFK